MSGDPGQGLEKAAEAEARLVRSGLVEVLDFDDPEAIAAWAACDLASMVEGCFHRVVDPGELDPAAQRAWRDRLAESYLAPGFRDDAWMTRYLWLLEGGARAGTIALPTTVEGAPDLGIWSLYVLPDRRGRGLAGRALAAAYDAALELGLRGIRLETHWVWQRALRFYLGHRMWVTGWKRAIELSRWRELPDWRIVEASGEAAFEVRRADRWVRRLRARTIDGRLAVSEIGDPGDASLEERLFGPPTVAVALALRGWPIAPMETAEPLGPGVAALEDLTAALHRFEAVARDRGWEVPV